MLPRKRILGYNERRRFWCFLRTKTRVECGARKMNQIKPCKTRTVSGRSEAEREQSISLADSLGPKNDLFVSPVGHPTLAPEWQSLLWTVMLEIQSNRSPSASNILKFAHKTSRDFGKKTIPKSHGHEYNFFDYASQSGPKKYF